MLKNEFAPNVGGVVGSIAMSTKFGLVAKAFVPMEVTLAGIVILRRVRIFEKAYVLIVVSVSGSMISVKLLQ